MGCASAAGMHLAKEGTVAGERPPAPNASEMAQLSTMIIEVDETAFHPWSSWTMASSVEREGQSPTRTHHESHLEKLGSLKELIQEMPDTFERLVEVRRLKGGGPRL
mmetsp:Transcript_32263/g.74500  ORF Transcript_32263/g.74500 Transcript_32263/m.74500 type:complete len:107 (-) Transcript_32263:100-420(-)